MGVRGETRESRPLVWQGQCHAGLCPRFQAFRVRGLQTADGPRTVSSRLAPYRIRKSADSYTKASTRRPTRFSTSYDDSRTAYVATSVNGAQGNCVLARTGERQFERVGLVRAVGDSVFWEDRAPVAAVNAHVGAANGSARVVNCKAHADAPVRARLRLARDAHDGRRAVNVHGLAHALARERLAERVFRRVRGDDLEDVATVAERRAVRRVEVLAQALLQKMKSVLADRAVVDRVFELVAVSVFGLPLQRDRAALEQTPRGNLHLRADERRVEARSLYVRVDGNLHRRLQCDADGQNLYLRDFGRDVSRKVREAHVLYARVALRRRVQNGAPLYEARARACDLRARRVAVRRAPVAPGHVGPLRVSAARLQLHLAATAPPDATPRGDELRVAHGRVVSALAYSVACEAEELALI